MKSLLLLSTILILIFLFSCSEKWIMDIKPRNYEFKDEYMQKKWEYFLSLENCKKIEYLDSIYRPILFNSDSGVIELEYDSLLYNNSENYYYWLFREVQYITNKYPSIFIQHGSYGGTHNRQVVPVYNSENKDSLNQFVVDINDWKDSLGCK